MMRGVDTTTCSSSSLSETPVSESHACSCGSPMIPTPSRTSPRSVSTSCVACAPRDLWTTADFFVQKIRTIELDGKTVKLQIVSKLG